MVVSIDATPVIAALTAARWVLQAESSPPL
jgi:hypothetical protein